MSVRPLRRSLADPIVHAVGARPNFIKMAPLIEALGRRGVTDQIVVHTGQHYDRRMSEEILEDLGFPAPDYSLGVGSGSHGQQTGKVLIAFEEILMSTTPAVARGGWRRQLHAGVRAGGIEARDPRRPPRGRIAIGGLDDARGDQPSSHRPPVRPAAHPQPGSERKPGCGKAST